MIFPLKDKSHVTGWYQHHFKEKWEMWPHQTRAIIYFRLQRGLMHRSQSTQLVFKVLFMYVRLDINLRHTMLKYCQHQKCKSFLTVRTLLLLAGQKSMCLCLGDLRIKMRWPFIFSGLCGRLIKPEQITLDLIIAPEISLSAKTPTPSPCCWISDQQTRVCVLVCCPKHSFNWQRITPILKV